MTARLIFIAALATALTLGLAIAPTHTRTPTDCTTAASRAAQILRHNQQLGNLVDQLEHPTSRRIVLGDNLPAYDHRTPDLGRCR